MYGGYGGGMYGGMGGMGGMGYGGYGYGMGGPMGMQGMDPNNPSLTQALEASTAQTFAVLQSIVQTFAGFSQMLESTFMATHSSFFAMVGVAEQLGNLRNAIGTVLGLFGLVRWMKETISGERRAYGGLGSEFRDFKSRPHGPNGQPLKRPSRKPLVIFLLAMFGIPYLMHRLIRSLQSRLPPPPGPLDPNNLQFAQALHNFSSTEPQELPMQKGDIIAILQTQDPVTGHDSPWWKGRNRAGKEGWFPMSFVEIVKRPGQDVKVESTQPVKTVD
jgi:peroxin-13